MPHFAILALRTCGHWPTLIAEAKYPPHLLAQADVILEVAALPLTIGEVVPNKSIRIDGAVGLVRVSGRSGIN